MSDTEQAAATDDQPVPAPPDWGVKAGDLVEISNPSTGEVMETGAVNYVDKDGVALVCYVGKSRGRPSGYSVFGSQPEERIRVHARYLRVLEPLMSSPYAYAPTA